MSRNKLRGLYAITDATLQRPDRLAGQVLRAIEGGAKLVQYRDKSSDASFRLQQASSLVAICRSHGVPLIINDDVALAVESGAHGVHLGKDDADLATARQQLGEQAIIGVSCYNSLTLAAQAAAGSASYIAFGRFFPSSTKPHAVQASLDLIRHAKQQWALPVVAIGGITPDNGRQLVDAGADMLAVVQGLFAALDVRQAAAAYADLFATE